MKLPYKAAWKAAAWAAILAVPGLFAARPAHAQAELLPYNTTESSPQLVPSSDPLGTLQATLVDSGWVSIDAAGNEPEFRITGRSAVYRNASGFLDFYYQVSNDELADDTLPTAGLHRFTASPISRIYTISVGYRTDYSTFGSFFTGTDGLGLAPTSISRTGSNIGASFGGSNAVTVGNYSAVVVVKTNAPSWRAGNMSLINDGTGRVNTLAAVPEPSSLAMVLPGLLPLGFVLLRRRKAAKPGEAPNRGTTG